MKKSFPIFIVFLCMGFGDAIGPFVSLAKETFQISAFKANLITLAGFSGFLFLSVPMGILQQKKSKKTIIIIGLACALTGLLIPLFGLYSFALFLIPIILLGSGNAIMQTGGNPIMRDVSPQGKFSRNLSLAQFIKAIGTLSTALLPLIAAKYWGLDWTIAFPVFSIFMFITLVWISLTPIKEEKTKNTTASFSSCFSLLKNRYIFLMVLGIFLYVGAEVSMSANLPLYLESEFNLDIKETGLAGTGLFFLALTIGRLTGGIVLNWIKPKHFLLLTCQVSILGIIGLFLDNQTIGFISAFIIGLGFANIFPLIFSISIDKMPNKANELSGLLVMAIFGGAIIPPLTGLLSDVTNILTGFIIPLSCIVYLTVLGVINVVRK